MFILCPWIIINKVLSWLIIQEFLNNSCHSLFTTFLRITAVSYTHLSTKSLFNSAVKRTKACGTAGRPPVKPNSEIHLKRKLDIILFSDVFNKYWKNLIIPRTYTRKIWYIYFLLFTCPTHTHLNLFSRLHAKQF